MLELTSFLVDGSRSLGDASCQIHSISSSFSNVNDWIGEHVEKAAKICLEKEETILLLQKSLEDAKKAVTQMQQKLYSLMGASIALAELRQTGKYTPGEGFQFSKLSSDINEGKEFAENELIPVKAQITEIQDNSALFLENKLSDGPMSNPTFPAEISTLSARINSIGTQDIADDVKLTMPILSEIEDTVNALCSDAETYWSVLTSEIHHEVTVYKESVHDVLKGITETRKEVHELKRNQVSRHLSENKIPSHAQLNHGNQLQVPQKIRNELIEVNKRLSYMNSCFYSVKDRPCYLDSAECSSGTEGWISDWLSPCSTSVVESVDNEKKSSIVMEGCTVDGNEELNSDDVSRNSSNKEVLDLLTEFRRAHGAFVELRDHLMKFCVGETDRCSVANTCALEDLKEQGRDQHDHHINEIMAGSKNLAELVMEEKRYPPIGFFDKFEEAYATIREADDMLKAMLKANETANMSTTMWKQAGEDLMADKMSLSEEIKELKSYIAVGDGEKEISNILSLLEGCFLQMQTGVEEVFGTAHRDIVKEIQAFCRSLRSSLEDLMCKAIKNDLSTFLFQRLMVEYCDKLRRRRSISTPDRFILRKDCGVAELDMEGMDDNSAFHVDTCKSVEYQIEYLSNMKVQVDLVQDESGNKNSDLVNQLKRKGTLLKGLLFDFSLLQEFASHRKDIKDELEKLIVAMSKVQHELQTKTARLDDVLVQNMKLEGQLAESQQALSNSNYELDQAKGKLNNLAEQNFELKDLLEDLYLKNSEADQLLEEQKEAIKRLEEEILRVSSSEKQLYPSERDIKDTLLRVTAERDEFVKTLTSLQERFNMVCTLADENQAIAAEARQDSEDSRLYADQKEEEVKILEHSVEELECTINVLEQKVSEMEDELERHRLVTDSLELELQELRHRLSTVEGLTESLSSENCYVALPDDQLLREVQSKGEEIDGTREQIRVLQEENARQLKEIKLFKDYISELVLHAEAQASQYQQKYKNLESMLKEFKTDLANVSGSSTQGKAEKISTRARGSSSPFKCIAGLVQQMNQEKDQELLIARLRVEELEALAASRHREVCILNTRLASAESMTHDVIRDLLGVKLDLFNYANIVDQHQLQRLIEDAQHKKQEFVAMEEEIANLRGQIDDLLEERERCISEINNNKEQQLTTEITVQQVQERDQLLAAQNNMLKRDKSNLQKRIVELDDLVKKLLKMQDTKPRDQVHTKQTLRSFDPPGERLADSQKMFSRINNQLATYQQSGSDTMNMRASGTKLRKHKL